MAEEIITKKIITEEICNEIINNTYHILIFCIILIFLLKCVLPCFQQWKSFRFEKLLMKQKFEHESKLIPNSETKSENIKKEEISKLRYQIDKLDKENELLKIELNTYKRMLKEYKEFKDIKFPSEKNKKQ